MSTPSRLFRSTCALFQAAKATPSAKKASPKRKKAAPKPKKAPKPAGSASPPRPRPLGLLREVPVSSALSDFLGGVPDASRTEAVKKIWDHIKLKNLQNPANKREIYCDDKLKTIFDGKDKVEFLEIAKLLSPHFVKAN